MRETVLKKIESLVDELKADGVSIAVAATEDMSEGYFRVVANEDGCEYDNVCDLLIGISKIEEALRDRLGELK